jgi:hypothetical protein
VALTEFRHGRKGGELKHGPIARRVMVIAPHDRVFEKTVSAGDRNTRWPDHLGHDRKGTFDVPIIRP